MAIEHKQSIIFYRDSVAKPQPNRMLLKKSQPKCKPTRPIAPNCKTLPTEPTELPHINKYESAGNSTHHKEGTSGLRKLTIKQLTGKQQGKNKENRSESLGTLGRIQTLNRFIKQKMQSSIVRFAEKEVLMKKLELQKRKKKKLFSTDAGQQEDEQFLRTFHKTSKKFKEQVEYEQFFQDFQLTKIQSVCYDSQFVHQRFGSCMAVQNNKIYLYGGAIRRKTGYASSLISKNYDLLFHSYQDGRWVSEPIASELSIQKKNLIHHTLCPVGKKFLVVAGGMVGDSEQTLTKFNRTVLVYNTQNKKVLEIPVNICLRSHACVSVENTVIIHGGIDEEGKIRSDINIVTLNNVSGFQSLMPKLSRIETNQALVNHQMVSTLNEDKSFKINLRENNGIYIFGGEGPDGKMSNQLKILRVYSSSDIDKRGPRRFEPVETIGQGPCGRKSHSLNLIANKSSLVVIGGVDQKTNILSDVWLISLLHLRWHRICTEPSVESAFGGICRHATTSNNTSIFIMGGYSTKESGSATMWKLDICSASQENRRDKRVSGLSKVSSLWSIQGSSGMLASNDKILLDDNL